MQSTNSEYGSPYLAKRHFTFTFFFTFIMMHYIKLHVKHYIFSKTGIGRHPIEFN